MPMNNGYITIVCDVEIKAADDSETSPPTFSVKSYNGGPLVVKGYPLPVVVDLAGLEYAKSVVANLDHDAAQRVGHVTEMVNDGSSLSLIGRISGTSPAAKEVLDNHKNGYPWQASIEAMPTAPVEQVGKGQSVIVNGQTFSGPLLVARKAKLYGFAFLSRGADESTSVSIAAAAATSQKGKAMDAKLEAWISAKGFDPNTLTDDQTKYLTAQYDVEVKASAKNTTPEQQSLDEILQKERDNRERIKQLTQITATAIHDAPEAIERIEAMARLAIEGGWDTDRYELELLRQMRPQARTVSSASRAGLTQKVLEAALCIEGRLENIEKHFDERTLEAAHDKFRNGIGLNQLYLIAARDNGYRDDLTTTLTLEAQRAAFHMNGPDIRGAGFSTVNLPNILSNTANKFLAQGFESVDNAWSFIASRRSVRDFKQVTSNALTGDLTYEKLGADGELKHGTAGERQYTNQADTYGRMFAITRQDLINDDTGALTAVPRRLGRGAALKINNVFWTVFLNNTGSHFTAGNNNVSTGAGSALTAAGGGINAAEVVFMNQTDPDGEPLGIMPSILLVPPTLKNVALRLMRSSSVAGSTTADSMQADTNIYEGRYTVVSSPYMENSNYTGYSTAVWYLLASPSDLPTIEGAFLNGRETPVVETADADFNVLGTQMRGYFDFGFSLQEVKAGVRSAGS